MATAKHEVDYMGVVRERLNAMEQKDRLDLSRQVGLSITTLYNIKSGTDARYSVVMKLYEATRGFQIPKRKAVRKARGAQ